MLFALITLITFWVSPLIVLLYQGWWAAHIWQLNQYSWRNIRKILIWDYSPEHRSMFKTTVKIIGLLFVSTALFSLGNLISYLGIAILVALWFNNALFIAQKALTKRIPNFSLNNRSYLKLFIYLALLTICVTAIFSYAFSPEIRQFQNELLSETSTALSIERASFTLLGNLNLNNIASAYLFLVFSSLLAGVWDLSSSLMFGVANSLAWPLNKLQLLIRYYQARSLLKHNAQTKKIIVAGDHYTRTITNLLAQVLGKELNIVSTRKAIDSIEELHSFVMSWGRGNIDVIIVELNDAFSTGAGAIASAIAPDYLILTGIDESSAVYYGSYTQLLRHKRDLLEATKPGGTVILNIEDHDLQELAGQVDLKEIYIHTTKQAYNNLRDHNLEIDRYYVHGHSHNKNKKESTLEIATQSHKHSVTLPHITDIRSDALMIPVATTLAIAVELGLDYQKINQSFYYLKRQAFGLSLYPTISESTFLRSDEATNITRLKHDLEYMSSIALWDKYLVTAGLPRLGQYKKDVYVRLAKLIAEHVQILVTFDEELAAAAKSLRNPKDFDVMFVKSTEQAILAISRRLEPGDMTLVNREIDLNLIRFFVDS